MTQLLTSAQMRAIEHAAIDRGDVTGLCLMERAGRGVVEAMLEEWPDFAKAAHHAVILCGPGNNGGDGFVIARLLKERGWQVEVVLYGDPERLPPDARANCLRWSAMGTFSVHDTDPPMPTDDGLTVPEGCDLLVDGLFGTGLVRPFQGPFTVFGQMRDDLRENGVRVAAIDIPSGICADSGRVLGATIPADLTVTFHGLKRGHVLADGQSVCGRVRVVDIGLTRRHERRAFSHTYISPERRETHAVLTTAPAPWIARKLPPSEGVPGPSHKYGHGHALVISGGPGKGGAARLAARGALRIGAGLVTVGCPPEALPEAAARLDAIMCRPLAGSEGLTEALDDARLNALCLGPGLGVGEATRALVWTALKAGRATVLDADALTSFADDPPALLDPLHERCVLTPHDGEFARVFPDIDARFSAQASSGPAYSKIDAACAAAETAGCTILMKGPDTVIASPGGRVAVNAACRDRAVPWLATAGAGDVLAGFITGLLARGADPHDAACAAAWLHVDCARSFGPGLIAEDLPERLPTVLTAL